MSNSRGATLRLTTAAAAVTLLAAACTSSASAVDTTPRAAPHVSPAATTPAATTTVGKQIVIANQGFPAAFGFTPDGAQIVYGLRLNGQIRFHVLASGADTLFYKVPNLVHSGEQGLLGVAVDPGFPAKAFVYAYAVRSINGTLRNQILAHPGFERHRHERHGHLLQQHRGGRVPRRRPHRVRTRRHALRGGRRIARPVERPEPQNSCGQGAPDDADRRGPGG